MNDAGVGRLLVASLHQGIADLLPTRLEFYEEWLNPAGLREGRIGLAPLAAVLSFLRQEGEAYRLVAGRAGEYSAEWIFAELPSFERRLVSGMPDAIRLRLVTRIARRLVRQTYGGSRAVVRWRKGRGSVDVIIGSCAIVHRCCAISERRRAIVVKPALQQFRRCPM